MHAIIALFYPADVPFPFPLPTYPKRTIIPFYLDEQIPSKSQSTKLKATSSKTKPI